MYKIIRRIAMTAAIAAVALTAGCGGDEPESPGGSRPGVESEASEVPSEQPELPATLPAAELADDTPRCIGGGMDMRYGTPGVMIVSGHADGSWAIADLDAGHCWRFTAERVLMLDGEPKELKRVEAEKRQGQTTWWHLTSAEGADVVLVVHEVRSEEQGE